MKNSFECSIYLNIPKFRPVRVRSLQGSVFNELQPVYEPVYVKTLTISSPVIYLKYGCLSSPVNCMVNSALHEGTKYAAEEPDNRQQDRVLVVKREDGIEAYAVIDGMGGYCYGAKAAEVIKAVLEKELLEKLNINPETVLF